jgi:porphobilinogen synthase
MRTLVRETTLAPSDLVLPLFFDATIDAPRPVGTMPGVVRLPVSAAGDVARQAAAAGLGGVLLFGLPRAKDARGTAAYDPDGPIPRAISALKHAASELLVITDVCLCEYTDHGHCGLLKDAPDGLREGGVVVHPRGAV